MSDKDRPVNPFGRSDRTIIRPNPGGRLPTALPSRQTPPPPESPLKWLPADELVAPNANPIMRAAGPLLLLLGPLRVAPTRASAASLMEQIADAINFFEKDVRSTGVSAQHANSAKYILCATADDIIEHIPTDDRHGRFQYSMLSRFFGQRDGGVRFFEILNRYKLDPLLHYPMLELQHACLALGFHGMHRADPLGTTTLRQIQRDLYETLRRVRPPVMRDLSPRWQGQALAMNSSRIRVPVWVVSSTAGALLFALFVTLRILLSGNAEAAAEMTRTLHSFDAVALKRTVPAPPPPPPPAPPPPKIDLDPCSQVIPGANAIVIRLCDQFLFDSGQAVLKNGFMPIAAQIASFLNEQTGKIKVVGHTDNIPLRDKVRFASNQELSKARALAVTTMVKAGMLQPDRIEIEGKGPDVPVASNATAEGRAKNRRVEIVISRDGEAGSKPPNAGPAR
jgi:type VI secretion system protein ImpK